MYKMILQHGDIFLIGSSQPVYIYTLWCVVCMYYSNFFVHSQSTNSNSSVEVSLPAACARPTAASLGLTDSGGKRVKHPSAEAGNSDGELDMTGLDDSELDQVALRIHVVAGCVVDGMRSLS